MAARRKAAAVQETTPPVTTVAEIEKVASSQNTAEAKKEITNDTLIECKCGVYGSLIYKSTLNPGYVVEWSEFGEVQDIEYRELVAMRGSQKRFFEDNWILIEDQDVLHKLGVERYYKNALTTENFDKVFKMSADEIQKIVPTLSAGTKDAIKLKAYELVKSGELDSVSAVKALEQTLQCRFDDMI